MYARMSVRISPDDVGARVSVRARNHDGDEAMVDVVGMLVDWRGGTLTIERRDGQIRRLAQSDLVAGRVVPPTPPRRR